MKTHDRITAPQWADYRVSQKKIYHHLDAMHAWLKGAPVWDYQTFLRSWGRDFEMHRWAWDRRMTTEDMDEFNNRPTDRFERTIFTYELRDHWIREFGFAIPCAELLDFISQRDLVIEVGAGSGYMTSLMRQRGINVIGSDPDDGHYGFRVGRYDPLQIRAQGKTMVRRFPDAAVFCSWPSLNATWFRQMLKAMRIGQVIIVIREDACAEHTAWEYMGACFEELGEIRIPVFPHMNDYAIVAVKKRQTPRRSK